MQNALGGYVSKHLAALLAAHREIAKAMERTTEAMRQLGREMQERSTAFVRQRFWDEAPPVPAAFPRRPHRYRALSRGRPDLSGHTPRCTRPQRTNVHKLVHRTQHR